MAAIDAGQGTPVARPRWVLLTVLLLLCGACLLLTAVQFHNPSLIGAKPFVTDFTTFHIVGSMAWTDDLADAYSAQALLQHQQASNQGALAMPWSYPPPFDLVVAALATVPLPVAYVLFTGGTLAAYLAVLRRLSGDGFVMLLLMLMPVLLVNIRSGQNGFLTGALVGLFAILSLRGASKSGVPLGLMVIKPHLGIGLGVLLLLGRRWRELVLAVAVASGALLVSTLAFGSGIWPAFLSGAAEASGFLEAGAYRLYRMTSVYASARSFGLPSDWALWLQGATALYGLLAVASGILWRWPTRHVLGVAALSTLMVSPYSYDYDLTILGIGLALVWAEVARSELARLGLLVGLWMLGGYGIVGTAIHNARPEAATYAWSQVPFAVTGPAYLVIVTAVLLALRHERRGRAAAIV